MENHNYNYHGHTFFCGHAGGTPIEYVKKAIELNYKHLGISEHAPMPNLPSFGSRLLLRDYKLYFDMLSDAKEYANKHNLNFYKAFEIEYFPFLDSKYSLYKKYLLDVDYLILGQHYIIKDGDLKSTFELDSLEDVILYRDLILEALDTNYFNLIAHLDLCFFNIKNPTDEMYEALRVVIKKAKLKNIPLEINANGIRRSHYEDNNDNLTNLKYPRLRLIEMYKEENAKVHISSDCHSVDALDDFAIKKAYSLVNEYGLDLQRELKVNYFEKKEV